jgi:hypothetical protein
MSNEFLQKKRNFENIEIENEIINTTNNKKPKIEETKFDSIKSNLPKEISENNDIMDLVFKYNITSGNLKCKLCQKEITDNIKFYCEICDYIFCINCFLLSKHNKDHEYHIIDALNFPLFISDFVAKEEHKLLSFVEKCGLNNWEEISKAIDNKGQVECESYYYSFYFKEKDKPLPDETNIILDANKNIKNNKLEENTKIYKEMISKFSSSGGVPPLGPEEENVSKNNARSITFKNGASIELHNNGDTPLNIYDAIKQASSDSTPDKLPAVFWRRNRQPWLVFMKLEDWLSLYNHFSQHEE